MQAWLGLHRIEVARNGDLTTSLRRSIPSSA